LPWAGSGLTNIWLALTYSQTYRVVTRGAIAKKQRVEGFMLVTYADYSAVDSLIHSAHLTIVFGRFRLHYRRGTRGNPPDIIIEQLQDDYSGLLIENSKYGIHIVTDKYEGYVPLSLVLTARSARRLFGRLRYAQVHAATQWLEAVTYRVYEGENAPAWAHVFKK
jgi:hypothetical protein